MDVFLATFPLLFLHCGRTRTGKSAELIDCLRTGVETVYFAFVINSPREFGSGKERDACLALRGGAAYVGDGAHRRALWRDDKVVPPLWHGCE